MNSAHYEKMKELFRRTALARGGGDGAGGLSSSWTSDFHDCLFACLMRYEALQVRRFAGFVALRAPGSSAPPRLGTGGLGAISGGRELLRRPPSHHAPKRLARPPFRVFALCAPRSRITPAGLASVSFCRGGSGCCPVFFRDAFSAARFVSFCFLPGGGK